MAAVAFLLLCFVLLFFKDVNILNLSISDKIQRVTFNLPLCVPPYAVELFIGGPVAPCKERQLRPKARSKLDGESDSESLSSVCVRITERGNSGSNQQCWRFRRAAEQSADYRFDSNTEWRTDGLSLRNVGTVTVTSPNELFTSTMQALASGTSPQVKKPKTPRHPISRHNSHLDISFLTI